MEIGHILNCIENPIYFKIGLNFNKLPILSAILGPKMADFSKNVKNGPKMTPKNWKKIKFEKSKKYKFLLLL